MLSYIYRHYITTAMTNCKHPFIPIVDARPLLLIPRQYQVNFDVNSLMLILQMIFPAIVFNNGK
ncbi:Uncharacterized protein EbC_22490 [Erwinia billingiae Eb661]|uniref:Uncharacterized protein n=1 Tax=Erwinia billingiae (strain Eb661) TaxID=634500 RepID=D8MSH3_ERWBE|nr:Uncharacterized protein EbC_22490 [Erwinia billingiae Eb661]